MKKSLLITALVLSLIYSVGGIYFYFKGDVKSPKIKNISTIKGYDYTLKSNATELMKEEFKILKNNLESGDIDDEAYAESIAKLFVIDIFTLNNKLNKYDVGGVDYIMPVGLDNFKLNITDTIYKYIENDDNNKRTQKLPIVDSINIEKQEETEFKINEDLYKGYKINLKWEYKIDYDYEDECEIIVIKDKKHYYVAEKK